MTRQVAVITLLCVQELCGQMAPASQSQPPNKRPTALYDRSGGPQSGRAREDFFHSSTGLVNKSDYDWGYWLAERRRSFIEASVGNSFFWYSALTTVFLMLLLTAYGVRVLDERRKLWRAAEILTDVWNQDQYSRAFAHAAVEKHNRHMLECNRVIEAHSSGRPSAASIENSDLMQQLDIVRAERDTLDRDVKRLSAELEKREKIVDDLSSRLEVLERDGQGARSGSASAPDGRLIARVNQLTQQLEAERSKNRALKGA